MKRVDRTSQIDSTQDHHSAPEALVNQGRAHGQEGGHAQRTAGLAHVEGSQLDREFVLARIPVADKLSGPRVEICLGVLDRFGKGLGSRTVQDSHAAAWSFRHLDPVKPGALVLTGRADRPYLAWRQWIAANLIFTL